MNCAEFQKGLPDFIEAGGSAKDSEHLKSCPVCSDLVKDLQYIAEAAKLLVPMEDPSPAVWKGIEKSLQREGLLRPAGGPARPEPFLMPYAGRGSVYAWAAMASLAVVALALIIYSKMPHQATLAENSRPQMAASANMDNDDEQLLEEVSSKAPAMRATYENNMQDVNAYISDARQIVEADPDDEIARDQLMNAYEQKAALYEMAMARAGQ